MNATTCDKCHRARHPMAIAQCKHPAVNEAIGHHICIYCCRGCRHHILYTAREHGFNAIACGFKEETP